MDEMITRNEHLEFVKRIEAEQKRTNARLTTLEASVTEIHNLSLQIERLAANMESMAKEQEKQGKQLEELESRDGKMWRQVVGWVVAAVIGGIITFLFTRIGL